MNCLNGPHVRRYLFILFVIVVTILFSVTVVKLLFLVFNKPICCISVT